MCSGTAAVHLCVTFVSFHAERGEEWRGSIFMAYWASSDSWLISFLFYFFVFLLLLCVFLVLCSLAVNLLRYVSFARYFSCCKLQIKY
mmetsp:Transcript_5241/g.11653  ORF Transcript_5241/g.11653 Transcript_5241/m.11653 type:complete len:88 (+) Transcript_5241:1126-1389(+)